MHVSKPRIWFAIAFPVLAAVCLTSVVRDPNFFALPKPTSDGPVYENMGYHLSTGHGFWIDWHDPAWRKPYEQSAISGEYGSYLEAPAQAMPMTGRPPLFPVVIAAFYSVVGRGPQAFAMVRVFSALCLTFGCALAVANGAAVISQCTHNGRKFSAWSISSGCTAAILLAASNRTLYSYAHDFLTEPLALLLTQLLVAALLKLTPSPAQDESRVQCMSLKLLAAVALTMAGMIWARSLFVLWIPGLWALLIILIRTPHRLGYASAVVLLTLLCLSPWWIRNCIVLGRWMPLGTQGSITLLGGYCDEAVAGGGDWQHAPEQRLRAEMRERASFKALSNDVERELMIADESKRRVRQWILAHGDALPKLFLMRIITHWNPYTGKSFVWKICIMAGAVYLVAKRRPEAWILVGLPIMNTVLVAALYTTGGRFLVPLYGLLFTLSAIGIAWLVELTLRYAMPKSPETDSACQPRST